MAENTHPQAKPKRLKVDQIKSIFLDMDETLCGTSKAEVSAKAAFASWLKQKHPKLDEKLFVERYIDGVYKRLNHELPSVALLLPNEGLFRVNLIKALMAEQGINICLEEASAAQNYFDQARMAAFEFFPGVKEFLLGLRDQYKLVVITNGPAFSQHPKLDKVGMKQYVDHIIVGGDEPEEKPAASIFEKALALVDASPSEVIHIGDSLTSDIDGANRVGIESIWIAPNDTENRTAIVPTHRLESILDLHKVLS